MSSYYVQHASDADYRKNSDPSEGPKHFMDIDYYPEFKTSTLTHNLDSLIAKYGSVTVTNNGILPWAISSVYDSVVVYMHNGDWNDANRLIADLGHYVGDAYQPLHCTENYNRNGVHSRYESTMLSDYATQISITPDTAHYIRNVLDFVFRVIYESNSKVQTIFSADDQATSLAGNNSSSLYYEKMWLLLDSMTISQLQNASVSLASLVYSAWVDAGSPPVFTEVERQAPLNFHITDLYPNPFNLSTNIDITVSQPFFPSKAFIHIYSLDGKLVGIQETNLHSGNNPIHLNFVSFASGAYLVVVGFDKDAQRERCTYKALLLK